MLKINSTYVHDNWSQIALKEKKVHTQIQKASFFSVILLSFHENKNRLEISTSEKGISNKNWKITTSGKKYKNVYVTKGHGSIS